MRLTLSPCCLSHPFICHCNNYNLVGFFHTVIVFFLLLESSSIDFVQFQFSIGFVNSLPKQRYTFKLAKFIRGENRIDLKVEIKKMSAAIAHKSRFDCLFTNNIEQMELFHI